MPAASVPRTLTVYVAGVSPVYVVGEVQGAQAWLTFLSFVSWHWKVAPVSFAPSVKVAVVPVTTTWSMVTTGGVRSGGAATVHESLTTGSERFPASSIPTTENVYVPGARSVYFFGDVQAASAAHR